MRLYLAPRETRMAAIDMFEDKIFSSKSRRLRKDDIVGKKLPGGLIYYIDSNEKKSIRVKAFRIVDFDTRAYRKALKNNIKENRIAELASIFWNMKLQGIK